MWWFRRFVDVKKDDCKLWKWNSFVSLNFALYSRVLKIENTVLTKLVEVWNLEEIYGHACLPFYFLKKDKIGNALWRKNTSEAMRVSEW